MKNNNSPQPEVIPAEPKVSPGIKTTPLPGKSSPWRVDKPKVKPQPKG